MSKSHIRLMALGFAILGVCGMALTTAVALHYVTTGPPYIEGHSGRVLTSFDLIEAMLPTGLGFGGFAALGIYLRIKFK